MLDHLGVQVSDYDRSKAFYVEALRPLEYEPLMEFDTPDRGKVVGFGTRGKPDFFLAEGEPGAPLHIAFASPDRATVEAFHAAALGAGGKDNGPPGPRPIYHEHYYGAYVHDPDGNNVEAVCHRPEG
jgi:catechol 2,3-dioxygenase-like lactoylglutathione lyase family enzyme